MTRLSHPDWGIELAEKKGTFDDRKVNSKGAYLGKSSPYVLWRHERISQTGRYTPECLASRSGPIWPWFTCDSDRCQGAGA